MWAKINWVQVRRLEEKSAGCYGHPRNSWFGLRQEIHHPNEIKIDTVDSVIGTKAELSFDCKPVIMKVGILLFNNIIAIIYKMDENKQKHTKNYI